MELCLLNFLVLLRSSFLGLCLLWGHVLTGALLPFCSCVLVRVLRAFLLGYGLQTGAFPAFASFFPTEAVHAFFQGSFTLELCTLILLQGCFLTGAMQSFAWFLPRYLPDALTFHV